MLRHVTLIPGRFSFQRTTFFHRLSDLLTQFQVDTDYTWEWHDMKGVVYMRLGLHPSLKSAEIYVGSTSATVSATQASRRRKYIQRCRNKLAFYEPAIKVWHRKGNYYHGVTLVLCHVAELPDRLATETALIRSLRPDLNHPFVLQTLSQLRLHENRFVLPKPGTGQRFAQRSQRFRKNHTQMDFDYFLSDRKLFISLHRLGSNTMHKFLEARVLRSRWISLPQLYLRQRLCNLLDEPWRTRAMKQLRLVLICGRGAVPPPNVPLRLPPLACDPQRAVRDQIRKIRQQARSNFPPLHLPSDRFIEIKGLPWSVIVFNFRTSLRAWMLARAVLFRLMTRR